MNALDCLRLYIGMPYGLAEDDARRRYQVQAVRSELQVHEEHAVRIGRLEGRDRLLTRLELQVVGKGDVLDPSQIQGICDVCKRERRPGEYQELLVARVSSDLEDTSVKYHQSEQLSSPRSG